MVAGQSLPHRELADNTSVQEEWERKLVDHKIRFYLFQEGGLYLCLTLCRPAEDIFQLFNKVRLF